MSEEFTDQEIDDALKFILLDNPGKEWDSLDDLDKAITNHILETRTTEILERLLKDEYIYEVSPGHFSATEKGLEKSKELSGESKQ